MASGSCDVPCIVRTVRTNVSESEVKKINIFKISEHASCRPITKQLKYSYNFRIFRTLQ